MAFIDKQALGTDQRPIRVLLLSRYGNLGASSRLRTQQFLPYLRSHGFDVSVDVLLDDDYVSRLYSKRSPNILRIAAAYFKRIARLMQGRMFDLVWVEREVFPWLSAAVELHILRAMGVPYVLQLDDAIFHRYSDHRFAVVRRSLGNKIERLMRGAGLVIAGSEYIAQHALSAGASWVERVPTVVDMERYRSGCPEHDRFTIGWIGTPATVHFLQTVAAPLREFLLRHDDAQLMVVGAKQAEIEGIDIVAANWTEATECQEVARFDIGIMPLADGAFEKGKCGYKLIQYMAAGKPVIASPVGSNRTIVEDGTNGFLAADDRDWINKLELLYQNPGLRRSMGSARRAVVEHSFSLQAIAPRVEYLLRRAAETQASQRQDECFW